MCPHLSECEIYDVPPDFPLLRFERIQYQRRYAIVVSGKSAFVAACGNLVTGPLPTTPAADWSLVH